MLSQCDDAFSVWIASDYLFNRTFTVYVIQPQYYRLFCQYDFCLCITTFNYAVYVNSRNIGKYRYSFWGEIYETVMAFSLVLPTLLSLVSPKLGKFNVTDKGDLLDKAIWIYLTVRPLIITALLLVMGISWVIIRYLLNDFQGIDPLVIVLNLVWATYSLFIVLASIAVGKETRQIRKNTRIKASLPITLHFDDGAKLQTTTEDIFYGDGVLRLK